MHVFYCIQIIPQEFYFLKSRHRKKKDYYPESKTSQIDCNFSTQTM